MLKYDVVVIGGGFAGLSAAVDLTARGARVIVLEGRPKLGGRATSYRDRVTGEEVDNGQHIIFGCYRETFRFLRTIGAEADVHLQSSLRVSYVDECNRTIHFRCPELPAPLHLVAGVIEWDELSASEKLGGLRMFGPLRRARSRADKGCRDQALDNGETARRWLVRHGQGQRIRELLWEPLALAALNQRAEQVAAAPLVRVLAELCGPRVSDSAIGFPTRPLEAFYAVPARRFIESRGGAVWTRAPARVTFVNSRLAGVEVRRELVTAPAIITAVPWFALPQLFDPPPSSMALAMERSAAMGAVPIVSVHLWFAVPVLTEPFLGLLGRTMQWVFDKRAVFGNDSSHLTMVSSGAEAVVGLSNDVLIRQALSDLRSAVPEAREIPLSHAMVIRERQATFSLAPGQPLRPDTKTVIRGLYMAGDWIETGLPGTIEGAVVSGHRAANVAYRELGS